MPTPLTPNEVEPLNPVLQVIVERALAMVDSGEATLPEAVVIAVTTAYDEGWADAEDELAD